MSDGFLRYYKRERITLDCEVVTPMFLGGADQSAQWRAAPFKALLRKWWRVIHGHDMKWQDLRIAEGEIFGTAGEGDEDSGKSNIEISVFSKTNPNNAPVPKGKTLEHPECERSKHRVSALPYLGGMGIMKPNGEVKHSYFSSGTKFTWSIFCPSTCREQLSPVIRVLRPFGTLGARSRNGWGSFMFNTSAEISGSFKVRVWDAAFSKDYPNAIGKDNKPLVWTTFGKKNWEEAMSDLAQAYIGVRAQQVGHDPKLDPGSRQASDRHLLGIPLTSHGTQFGNVARHASPLHFKVMKKANSSYFGIIVHLPHAHSEEQQFMNVESQKEVWRTVHRKLDGQSKIIQRADLRELLA